MPFTKSASGLGERLRILRIHVLDPQMSSDVLISAVSALAYINQVANDLANAPPARPLPRRRAALDPIRRANISPAVYAVSQPRLLVQSQELGLHLRNSRSMHCFAPARRRGR